MWPVLVVLSAIVISIGFFGGWIFAVPLAVAAAATLFITRGKRGHDRDVSRMRERADGAAPRDRGGVEFTDRDRETLSS